ncbi:protein trichome birefringence-like 34 [Malania oleifera]|uniref:protein trichome birefringence-like 34 n=1 Tax=Malania oleifera TaxID=397392 RepID=UPI0025AEB9EC|nr:protein trichome birefringence-like 34 [Malania oleifera]
MAEGRVMAKKAQAQAQVVVSAGAWGLRIRFHSLAALLVTAVVVAALYMTGESERILDEKTSKEKILVPGVDSLALRRCSLFSGKWVFDNHSYPLYRERECTYMSDQLACGKFGRKDLSYQNWRWQPHDCDLPKFNATALLETLRNKRMVFVGDSLNRGQWVSMVCLVESSIPPNLKSMHSNGSLTTFKATEYNASIEFYWAPLLVESNSDDPLNHRVEDRTVRVQAIEKHARHWTHADILVFNSYLWWRRSQMKILWGSFETASDAIYKEVEMPRCYEMALRTWADWLEIHVNRTKTRMFFVTMSPTHQKAEEWGGMEGQNCYNETEIISKEGYEGNSSNPGIMQTVDDAIQKLKARGLNVQTLNITQLSEYRKEGHPSIYRKQWEPLTQEHLSNPSSYADCIHWCLPGIPDVWNELLYASIF